MKLKVSSQEESGDWKKLPHPPHADHDNSPAPIAQNKKTSLRKMGELTKDDIVKLSYKHLQGWMDAENERDSPSRSSTLIPKRRAICRTHIHRAVCRGDLTLQEAQAQIRRHWTIH